MNRTEAEKMMLAQGVRDYHVRLMGVRGYYDDPGGNRLGIYDDAIFRWIGDRFDIFRASTDPGIEYVKDPMNEGGCARLRPGLWWYRMGNHRGRPALVQDGEMDVDRLDRFGVPDFHERGLFGINLHSGGAEKEVGRYSAGCQIIHSPEGPWGDTWRSFFEPLAAAMLAHQQKQAPYLLIEV